jgi:hypothetical protein
MLGFGGHFLTKGRRYSITFALLRGQRIVTAAAQTSGPERERQTSACRPRWWSTSCNSSARLEDPAVRRCSPTPPAAMAENTKQAAREYLAAVAA